MADNYVQYLSGHDAFQTALDRMRWIFDEFDGKVIVSTSGGKDSTVTLELALMVAREKGYLPLKAYWLDQECEFESTVRYQRYLADRPEIDFDWYQVPFRLFNATDHANPWLDVWGPGEDWVRPKEPDSIHDNPFGTTRFGTTLGAIDRSYDGVTLTGMRVEESPRRRMTLLSHPTYKWVTWTGGSIKDNSLKMHPVYDWSYRDVWKAIEENGWRYNTHYDQQFRYGVPVRNMRVSNYHHETALSSLTYLQEVEPVTWEAATRRLAGIHTYAHMPENQVPKHLPYMFTSWYEYMEYLITNLVSNPDEQKEYWRLYHKAKKSQMPESRTSAEEVLVRAVIINDSFGTTVDNWISVQPTEGLKRRTGGKMSG